MRPVHIPHPLPLRTRRPDPIHLLQTNPPQPVQIIPILIPQLPDRPRATMRIQLRGCRHCAAVCGEEVPEAMVVVDFDGGAFARVEDGFGEGGELYGEFFVFETAAVEERLPALGVVVFAHFASFVAGEVHWGA